MDNPKSHPGSVWEAGVAVNECWRHGICNLRGVHTSAIVVARLPPLKTSHHPLNKHPITRSCVRKKLGVRRITD